MEKVTKVFDSKLISAEEGKREVVSIISTDIVDRDGEVVKPSGLKKKNYQGNPVVLVGHDWESLPVGRSLWIKSGVDDEGHDVLISKAYISDKTQQARDVFGLLQDGVLSAFSVGFLPIRSSKPTTKEINARPDYKEASLIHREWELLEYSLVAIPANPKSISLAVSKGYSKETLDMLTRNSEVTAKAIVEEVAPVMKRSMMEGEVKKLLAKRLDTMNFVLNPDRVFSEAMKALSLKAKSVG